MLSESPLDSDLREVARYARRLGATVTLKYDATEQWSVDVEIPNEATVRAHDYRGLITLDAIVANVRGRLDRLLTPSKVFVAHCTPAQRERLQRILHELKCLKREVADPHWVAQYDRHLAPPRSAAQMVVEDA